MLRDDTTSCSSKLNNDFEPSASGSGHRIEFPSCPTDPTPSEVKDALLQKKFSPSLPHLSLSRSTTAPKPSRDPTKDNLIDLNRASLDRRISLPLLGIDLGRSGPSYGQTLKRMSVAVYGMAHNAFETDSMEVNDLTSRFNLPPRNPPMRTSLTHAEDHTFQSLNGRNSNSNDGKNSLGKDENEGVVTALQPLATNAFSLKRSQSLQKSQGRNVQARKLNLPFKSNVKYPLKGIKLDSTSVGKIKFPCQSDLNAQVPVPSDAQPEDLIDSSTFQLNETLREIKLKKKRQVVRELIESERRYFDLLSKIQQNYILPVQANQRANDGHQKMILSRKTAAHIFSNFTAILGLSSQFLASLEKFGRDHVIFDQPASPRPALLPEVLIQSPTKGIRGYSTNCAIRGFNIGEIMIQFLPFFKLYATFTSNFSVSQSTLHLHSAKRGPSPEFIKLLDDCHQRGIDGGLGLAHMLLGIIQRVPRYELLIRELVKHSTHTDCDYRDLLSAQNMVGSVVRGLEIGMNEQTESKTILTIQRAMEGLPFPLVIPSRKLVKIGQLKKIGRKGDLQDRIFFLFNDCLIYSGTIRSGNVESVDKWLGQLTASFKKSSAASSFRASSPASSTTVKPITTSFLLPFTYGDDNSPRLIFCRKMELHDVTTIGAVSGQKSNCSTAFQIISSSKSFIVYTRDALEKEDWISCLREAKSELLDSRRTLFKEDTKNRETTLKFDKLGYIAESPSQEFSQLPLMSQKDTFKSDLQREIDNVTPQKTRPATPTTFFPVLSNCRLSGAVTSSMITRLLSPRARHNSTLTKSLNLNWKNFAQLGASSIESPTAQTANNAERSECLDANVTTSIKSDVLPELNLHNQVSENKRNQVEENRSLASRYVAENYCAPVWVPDSDVNRCMGECQTWFSVLKRRHHCRMCGGVFCSSCSSRMFLITNQEHGDQIARACEGCFKSVFLDLDTKETKQTSGGIGSYRPILSNRLHDDQGLLFRRDRPHLKHSHRQSLPIDMGSAHFRHSLADIRDDDQRRSIVSAGTSVGSESVCENSKNDPNGALSLELSLQQNQNKNSNPVSIPSHTSKPTDARQRLSSLLQNRGLQRF